MKIDRLIGIITILLQNEKVTAPYLAERFEVSKRTINRDIEDICRAGIPIVTMQGSRGGISIAKGYRIDKTLLTRDDLRALLTGLSGLESVAEDKKYQNLRNKFFTDRNGIFTDGHIMIDLSSHYKSSLAPKISSIEQSAEQGVEIEFFYYGRGGGKQIILEPYYIIFQWSSWYVFGYVRDNEDFRLFKLNRLWNLQNTGRVFVRREIPEEKMDFNSWFTNEINAVILFDKCVKYRLVDEYGIDCCSDFKGKVKFESAFTDKEYLISWVLGFGNQAELLEPEDLRAELKIRLENAYKKYSQ